jgi:hypothetical protein
MALKTFNSVVTACAFATASTLSIAPQEIFAQDPNFHIYLAFGQSNMEGNAQAEAQDKTGVDPRFQMMAAVNWSDNTRKQGSWYTAVPPLCRPGTGLNPCDYFGRTLVDSLPASIKVGVINVAVAGCAIEMFDEAKYQTYVSSAASWLQNIANQYGGNPYARLVEVAKIAQKDGVIKGILLHQGESGSSTNQWAAEVKIIYNNLIKDLSLDASKTPLLVGDLVKPSNMIKNLPNTLPSAHVISSNGITERGDGLHFDAKGYRDFGKRYAQTMLTILAMDPTTGISTSSAQAGFSFEISPAIGASRFLEFQIPHRASVSVNAYNLGGKVIAHLAQGEFSGGWHSLPWNERALPSGINFIRLESGSYTQTQRISIAGE